VPRRDQRVTAYTPGGAHPLRSSPITNRLSGRPTGAWWCAAHGRVLHAHLTLAFADIPTARESRPIDDGTELCVTVAPF
jgi:hypothetical protein